jgi:hypothetical protein
MSRPDLRRRLDVQATAEQDGRCWGLDVQVGQWATRQAADARAPHATGAPGSDGVTCAASDEAGVEACRAARRDDLVTRTSRPLRHRRVESPNGGGTGRVRGMPARRDRVGHGALPRILEPLGAADFQAGSVGYRPTRTAPPAVDRVAEARVRHPTRGLDVDLAAYGASVRPDLRRATVAHRVHDRERRHVRQLLLHVSGTRGVPPGGVMAPRLRHIDRTAVEARRERAKAAPRHGAHPDVASGRSAAALVSLGNNERRQDWRVEAGGRRRRAARATREVPLHEAKRRLVDRSRGERGGGWGVDCRRVRAVRGRWRPQDTPQPKARTAWRRERKEGCRRDRSPPVDRGLAASNPRRRGWVHDCRSGPASRCVAVVRVGVERRIRRHWRRARQRRGVGWQRWRTAGRHTTLGVFGADRVRDLVRA